MLRPSNTNGIIAKEEIQMDTINIPPTYEKQVLAQRQTIDFDDLKLSKDTPPLFKNVWQENLEELEKEIVQNPHVVNQERFLGNALIHIATKAKKLGSLQTLFRNGAKVSLTDPCGETALHNAVTGKWEDGILELLQQGASPDKLSEPKSTVREVYPQTALHIAVMGGDNQSVALLLRHSPNLSLCDGLQRTVLHMAAEAQSMKLLTRLLNEPSCHKMISQMDWIGNTVLHAAIHMNKVDEDQEDEVEKNILNIVELLIENGVDVNSKNYAGVTPIYLAALNRLPKVAKVLLKSGADLSIITDSKNTILHAACESDCNICLNIFLDTGKVNHFITTRNNKGKDPFHIAIESSSRDCCESLLINGDNLGYIDTDGKTRCSLILENIPNAIELLNRVLDHHLHVSKKCPRDTNFHVKFDYSAILRQQTEELQFSLIPKLTSPLYNQILKHPLIESFLFLKWNRLKRIFYCYVFLYFLFLIVHSYFVFCTFGPLNVDKNWNTDWLQLLVIRLIHVILYACFLISGLVMVLCNSSFVKETETYCITMSLLASAFVIFSPNVLEKAEDRSLLIERPIAALSAFLSWSEFMLLLGKFPYFGAYISMLSKVAKSVLKVLFGFSSLLVGSAICFSIMYRDQNVFSSFMHSIVKILMMMIGEYNYVEMPKSEDNSEEAKNLIKYFGSIFIIFFVFIVSILMTNLIIGVAVYDIGELLRHGKIERLYKQAQYIISYENLLKFFFKNHRGGRIPRLLAKIGQIPINPKIYPNRYDYTFNFKVPEDTIKETIKIKNMERDKEDICQVNEETDAATIMKTFRIIYMTNIHKQRNQNKLLLNRLDNLEKFLYLNLSKPNEEDKITQHRFKVSAASQNLM